MSRDIYKEMCELLNKENIVNRHSFFQMKYFIINKEPTHQSKLWRCLRELQSRCESIEAIQMEIEDCHDNLELLDIEIKKGEFDVEKLNTREVELKTKKLERRKTATKTTIISLEKKLKEVQEEAVFFLEAFNSLEKKEKLKPFDDMESQKEYWNEKIAQEFRFRALTGTPADVDLARTTMCLMDDMPVKQQFLQAIERKMIGKPND